MRISRNRFAKAVEFVVEEHTEPRKGTTIPYVSHLMSVSSLVLEFGGNEDEAIAGLLHDVVEDTPATLEMVREQFGEVVADIVAGCSEKKNEDGSGNERPWKDRKDDYIAHALAADTPPSMLLVSMADKLHNLQCILHDFRREGHNVWLRFNKDVENMAAKREATLWFYRTLADGFSDHPSAQKDLAKELDAAVSELEGLGNAP